MNAKPWGAEEVLADTPQFVVKQLHIRPGESTSAHMHATRYEVLHVLTGPVMLERRAGGDVTRTWSELVDGETVVIAPGLVHRLTAKDTDVYLLETTTAPADDLQRVADDYGRV